MYKDANTGEVRGFKAERREGVSAVAPVFRLGDRPTLAESEVEAALLRQRRRQSQVDQVLVEWRLRV